MSDHGVVVVYRVESWPKRESSSYEMLSLIPAPDRDRNRCGAEQICCLAGLIVIPNLSLRSITLDLKAIDHPTMDL